MPIRADQVSLLLSSSLYLFEVFVDPMQPVNRRPFVLSQPGRSTIAPAAVSLRIRTWRISRRPASAIALKTSGVVEAQATWLSYAYIDICKASSAGSQGWLEVKYAEVVCDGMTPGASCDVARVIFNQSGNGSRALKLVSRLRARARIRGRM